MAAGCSSHSILARGAALLTIGAGALSGVGAADASRAVKPGSPVAAFGHGGAATLGAGTRLLGAAAQPDGRAVVVGQTVSGSHTRLLLARFTARGSLDGSFGSRGIVDGPPVPTARGTGSIGRAVALQPDGKIVVVGTATNRDGSARDGLLVERYDSHGRLDRSFGRGGVVNLLAGSFGDGYAVAMTPDEKILAAGSGDAAGSGHGSYARAAVARLTAGGAPDPSFGAGGVAVVDLGPFSTARAVATAASGKVIVAGSGSPDLRTSSAYVARLTAGGHLDPGFGVGGAYFHQYAAQAAYSRFQSLSTDRAGRILAGGAATSSGQRAYGIVARLTPGGAVDGSFGSGGSVYALSATHYSVGETAVPGVTALAAARNGDVLAAGTSANGVDSQVAVWRFTSRGRPAHGFGSPSGVARLQLPAHLNGEAAAEAFSPAGSVIVAGDESPPGRPLSGLVALLAG